MPLTNGDRPVDLGLTPAGEPPEGVVPNLGPSAQSQQSAIIGCCVIFIILTTFLVTMRLYVAFRITKLPAMENCRLYLCVIAAIFSFAYMSILIHLSYASRHMWDVPLAWMFASDEYWKLRLAQNLLSPLAFFFSRVPIFMLYSRIFQNLRWFRFSCYAGIAAAFAIYLHTIPVVAILCIPKGVEAWTNTIIFDRCSRGKPDSIVQGVGNIVLDLYALILPLPVVWGLHLPSRKKIGVMIVFLTGSFALIASCVSLYYRLKLTYGSDTNWDEGAYDASSGVIEINIAIICSCMPSLSSLVKSISNEQGVWLTLRSVFHSQSSNTGNKYLHKTIPEGELMESHESERDCK